MDHKKALASLFQGIVIELAITFLKSQVPLKVYTNKNRQTLVATTVYPINLQHRTLHKPWTWLLTGEGGGIYYIFNITLFSRCDKKLLKGLMGYPMLGVDRAPFPTPTQQKGRTESQSILEPQTKSRQVFKCQLLIIIINNNNMDPQGLLTCIFESIIGVWQSQIL